MVCPGAAWSRPGCLPSWEVRSGWRCQPGPAHGVHRAQGPSFPGAPGGRSREARGPPRPCRLWSAGISSMGILIPVVLCSQDSAIGPKAALQFEGMDTR